MKKNKILSKTSAKKKAEVLAALALPGRNLTKISKTYGIGRGTIYAWLKEQNVYSSPKQAVSKTQIAPQFLEMEVKESTEENNLQRQLTQSNQPILEPMEVKVSTNSAIELSKASLIFRDFSLIVEGKFSSEKLISILKILEISC